jgi:hypothetical protein
MTYETIVVAALVAVTASRTGAHAQSATAQAETLFRQGKDLIAHGKIAEACAAFDTSQKLDPTIATLLNQASCREKNGQLATAWGLFLDAERQSRAASDDATRQLHQVATNHAATLEPRLSTLTITVPVENRVSGLEILRNNEPVDPGAWNKALPVDGGTYQITARAPGTAESSRTITVGVEHDAKAIEAPVPAPEPKPAVSSAPAGSPASTAPPLDRGAPWYRDSLGVGLVGAGTVAMGVATYLLWDAHRLHDEVITDPDQTRRAVLHDRAGSRYLLGTVAGIGGASMLVVGILRLASRRPDRSRHDATSWNVDIAGNGVMVFGQF